MDFFAWSVAILIRGYNAVVGWFGQVISASGVTALPVILGLFFLTVVMALIIMPIRGAALSDMANTEWKSMVKSKGKYSSGRAKWFGGRKGKFSK